MLTPSQHAYRSTLHANKQWTKWLRERYPGCEQAKVVIAWSTELHRWVFCRAEVDSVLTGESFSSVDTLTPFYVWQGLNSIYLPIDERVVDWFRDHDTFSAGYRQSWDDIMFAEKVNDDPVDWDVIKDGLRDFYRANRESLQGQSARKHRESKTRKWYYKGCLQAA